MIDLIDALAVTGIGKSCATRVNPKSPSQSRTNVHFSDSTSKISVLVSTVNFCEPIFRVSISIHSLNVCDNFKFQSKGADLKN